MQPRIYTYKVTFKEVPYWYWGSHKEKRYGEKYLGTPKSHKWMWDFYTPEICILEFFETWEEARKVENRLIKQDLEKKFCLNEHCGGSMSLASLKKGYEAVKNLPSLGGFSLRDQKSGIFAYTEAEKSKRGKRAAETNLKKGTAVYAEGVASLGGIAVHAEKDETGKSLHAKKMAITLFEDPDHPELGHHNAGNLAKKQKALGLPHGKENRRRMQ